MKIPANKEMFLADRLAKLASKAQVFDTISLMDLSKIVHRSELVDLET